MAMKAFSCIENVFGITSQVGLGTRGWRGQEGGQALAKAIVWRGAAGTGRGQGGARV